MPQPLQTDVAIPDAIVYRNAIAMGRTEARPKLLQQHWTSRARNLPRVVVNTPAGLSHHGGIGNVGLEASELAKRLMAEFGIFAVAVDCPGVRGLRVTPSLYTTADDLVALVAAIRWLSV